MEISLPMLKQGRSIYFMFMPEGEDPDSFVRQNGKQAFEDQSLYKPLSDYLITMLTEELDLSQLEGQSAFLDQVQPHLQPMLSRLP